MDARSYKNLIDRVRDEIKRNHALNEKGRRDEAKTNANYYKGRIEEYQTVDNRGLDRASWRSVPVMRRIVDVLCSGLYKEGPTRKIGTLDDATAFLDAIYKANAIDAVWQAADKHTCVNEVACFEVYGVTGPQSLRKPVGVRLWTAQSFNVWVDPDDGVTPLAVATWDIHDEQTRVRLWHRDGRETYVTSKLAIGQTSGGRAMELQAAEPNPYRDPQTGDPILPFAFAHWDLPLDGEFWCGSPGTNLREVNAHLNKRLTKAADDIWYNRPIGVVSGAEAGWNFPANRKAGQFTTIPVDTVELTQPKPSPAEVSYVVCDFGYLAIDWQDLKDQLEMTMQAHGVPPAAVRMEQTGTQSGVAIVSEQIPLVTWQEGRRRPFTLYEQSLARVVLAVACSHAENNEATALLDAPIEAIRDGHAAADELTLRWKPSLSAMLQAEQQQANAFLLDNYLASRTQLAMRLFDLSRDEAEQYIAEVAKDVEREKKLFGEDQPEAPPGALPADPTATPEEADAGRNPDDQPADQPQAEEA